MQVTFLLYPDLVMDYSHFTVPLYPYLQAYPAGVDALWVDVGVGTAGRLRLSYRLKGNISSLRIPALQTAPGPADGLWQHTCFEAFLAPKQEERYQEFNFSPSGQWQTYEFLRYRERLQTPEQALLPKLNCRGEARGLCLTAELPGNTLKPGQNYCLGLSTVLELENGELTYWALTHPADKPDFHHRDGFILTLTGHP